jgi:hypothetical protein
MAVWTLFISAFLSVKWTEQSVLISKIVQDPGNPTRCLPIPFSGVLHKPEFVSGKLQPEKWSWKRCQIYLCMSRIHIYDFKLPPPRWYFWTPSPGRRFLLTRNYVWSSRSFTIGNWRLKFWIQASLIFTVSVRWVVRRWRLCTTSGTI